MTNDELLRRVSAALAADAADVARLIEGGGAAVDGAALRTWLDGSAAGCPDAVLVAFLDGLIADRRGARDAAAPAARAPSPRVDNNLVFRKLKIALGLEADAALRALRLGGCTLSRHELSAFFRRADSKHYRRCKDAVLVAFLRGLELRGE